MSFLNLKNCRLTAIFIWLTGLLLTTNVNLVADQPNWIWSSKNAKDGETLFFRKDIKLNKETKSANLTMSCDNGFEAYVNGKKVLVGSEWSVAQTVDVKKHLKRGKNVIAVRAWNDSSNVAGLVGQLDVASITARHKVYSTDKSWIFSSKNSKGWMSLGFDAQGWKISQETGKLGDAPWGNVFTLAQNGGANLKKNNPNDLKLAKDFKSELLYNVPKGSQGSWVAVCVDDKGRIIASDQGNKGLYRIDPRGEEIKVEKLDINISSAQGLLYAHGALWVNINGKNAGVHRLTDTNGDDQFDKDEYLKPMQGGGEHGPHALVLSPDKEHIYVIGGNHTKLPKTDTSVVPTNWDEDLLLKRLPDARGHAANIRAPGGWIARFDKDGKNWETVAIGFRNQYDMAFNLDGELFSYDADMEWDAGTPWYRPTRLYHVTSGADFGWRTGTGKWPQWYPDMLPPAYDIGPGSPVGVTSGLGAKFPAKYQKAIYCLDWTYGTMSAMFLSPAGASYTAVREEFVASSQMRMTDAVINPYDGAMYYTVGGRGGQSELHRVTYIGDESTKPVKAKSANAADRKIRRSLEALHKPESPNAVNKAWKYLGHNDRHIRWAARIAIELQPPSQWQDKALSEKDTQASLTALCALARQGEASLQGKLIKALNNLNWAELKPSQQAELLRVYQLAFIRMGKPSEAMASSVEKKLDPIYPAPMASLNRELCTILVYLESPNVASKTLALMSQSADQSKYNWSNDLLNRNSGYAKAFAATAASSPQRDQIHYAKELRNLKKHWTKKQRLEYFRWYRKAESFKGGNSFAGFLNNFRKEALANVPKEQLEEIEKIQKAPIIDGPPFKIDAKLSVGVTPPMKFDKAELKVKAGAGVELAFTNNDPMPMMHNLLIVEPGSRVDIVTKAATMGPAGMINSFVPESDKVIAATPLVLTGNTYNLYFKAPVKPGKYEYVCTYPGHGFSMWGTLIVE